MKSTGIVRKLDELGRIVLPIELRRTLNIEDRAPLEIFVEDNAVVLRKYEPACIFCGSSKEVTEHHGRGVCKACMQELSQKV